MNDLYSIILYPVMTESANLLIEKENKLVFMVHMKSNKHVIKAAIEKLYDVEVEKVNLLITPKGTKKAFVKLRSTYQAVNVAIKLGIL